MMYEERLVGWILVLAVFLLAITPLIAVVMQDYSPNCECDCYFKYMEGQYDGYNRAWAEVNWSYDRVCVEGMPDFNYPCGGYWSRFVNGELRPECNGLGDTSTTLNGVDCWEVPCRCHEWGCLAYCFECNGSGPLIQNITVNDSFIERVVTY